MSVCEPAAMASATRTTGLIALSQPHSAALCPQPLHVQKRLRQSSFHRTLLRKYSHNQIHGDEVYGPLDDIIDEIKGEIWRSPPLFAFGSSSLAMTNALKASATLIVTPLPVSRIPSDVPLTIRKQRASRSTASGSSYSDAMCSSRNTSQDQSDSVSGVSTPSILQVDSWPLFGSAVSQDAVRVMPESSSNTTICTEQLPTTQKIKSRFRRLTNALPPLLRRGTSNGNQNNGPASNVRFPIDSTPDSPENTEDSVQNWIPRNVVR